MVSNLQDHPPLAPFGLFVQINLKPKNDNYSALRVKIHVNLGNCRGFVILKRNLRINNSKHSSICKVVEIDSHGCELIYSLLIWLY